VCCKCKKDCWACVFNETINYKRYVQVTLGQFFPELTEEERLWQVLARLSYYPHCTYVYAGLSDVYREGIISSGIWPAHSPDLNPCDTFFWNFLKDKVHDSNARMEEPKENIHKEIANIPAEQLERVNQNPLLLVQGMSECRRTAFSTPLMICEL
jgi:hypothetical protein